jgi:hypothetical protein
MFDVRVIGSYSRMARVQLAYIIDRTVRVTAKVVLLMLVVTLLRDRDVR